MEDYKPLNGFYDLREFNLTKREFKKIYNIQKFLFEQSKRKKYLKKYNPIQWEKLKELSAQYQLLLLDRRI